MFKKIYFKKIVFALFSHLVLIVFWFQKRSFVKMINLILKEVKSTWFSFPYLMKFPCSLAAFGTKNFHIVHCSSIFSKRHILFSLLTFLIFCLYFFLYFFLYSILYFLFSLWNVFVDAACHSDNPDAAIIQAISELPLPNRDTLAYLMIHFQTVAENYSTNKMGKIR